MRVTGRPFCCAGEQIWSLMSWKSENLSFSLSPLIWDRLRRDSGLETASQSSPPPRLPAMRRECGLESLRIFLGFRNQRLRSQIQTSPMELPGPDSEDLKTSWKTPKQVRPYERPSTKQWHGACLLEALIAPQRRRGRRSPCSLTGPRHRLPCFRGGPKLFPPTWPLSPVYSPKL